MKIVKMMTVFLMALFSPRAFAGVVCESESGSQPARLEFQALSYVRYEALVMDYQGRSVLKDPRSIFNHMGLIIFRGEGGIEFVAHEFDDEFTVKVPVFGGQLAISARGKCKNEGE